MLIRILIASFFLWAPVNVHADEEVPQLIKRGAWTAAGIQIYDFAWSRRPSSDIAISLARSGFTDIAIARADEPFRNSKSYVLRVIAEKGKGLTDTQRTHILDEALRAATSPDQQVSIALAWANLGKPERAIGICRKAMADARGNRDYTRRILEDLAISENAPLASALAQDLVAFAKATQGDDDPYIYLSLAQLLGLAGDEIGLEKALQAAEQRVYRLPQWQQTNVRTGMVNVALLNDRTEMAAIITPQKHTPMEWARYYARHRDYGKAEDLTQGMRDTLYVSPRTDSLAYTIRTAVANGDIRQASDMVDRLVNIDSAYVKLQLFIGRAYVRTGRNADASSAYAKAAAKYLRLEERTYSQYDAEVLAQLVHASRIHGEERLAKLVMDLMPTIIAKNYSKNLNGQILSRVYFAAILNEAGEKAAASTWLAQAYEILKAEPEPEKRLGFDNLELRIAEGLGEATDLELPNR
ncbi:hypothetical protein LOY67_12950 [Pseudomonas sp. B21-056]|uniref:hypothetical protein n=1 Tax=Pseudomonas sp. B21-056 TaxID=2895495 RepID=UPI002232A2D7|nr:hypothetical protein [Pseudomonas sp. B21-056]UZE26270.1 hypothetical protein LOY67_12950 [Pseudomonas sp. B21-056]